MRWPILIPNSNSSDGEIEVRAPYNNDLIAKVESADKASVEKALDNAYKLFKTKKNWLSPSKRIAILEKTVRLMVEQSEELALDASLEGGKPLVDSRVEVTRAIDGVKECIEFIRTQVGKTIPMNLNKASENKIAFTRKEPIGIVVAVSAFNHPLNLIVHQVCPAVAVGCPVIIKPAEDTPISCFNLITLLRNAGLPEQWCQGLITKDMDVATQLVTDARVGFFSFIGSARVGWMLRSKLAPGVRCALEHGGAAPVIIAEDADLSKTIPSILKAGFYHAGQVCVSVQRVFVPKSILDEVVSQIKEGAEGLKVGDPLLENTEVGPLIRKKEIERVESWVNEAVEQGTKVICGGKRISDSCYECTVLLNPPEKCNVSQNEIFGPVICIYSYQDLNEAISKANSLPVAFQAAVFTKDIDTAMKVYTQIDASTVMVNEHTAFRVDWMPFAGLKQSGLGVGGIPYTMKDMQIEKMMVINSKEL